MSAYTIVPQTHMAEPHSVICGIGPQRQQRKLNEHQHPPRTLASRAHINAKQSGQVEQYEHEGRESNEKFASRDKISHLSRWLIITTRSASRTGGSAPGFLWQIRARPARCCRAPAL